MKLKTIVNSIIRDLAAWKMTRYYSRFYGKVMSINGIPDSWTEGEDEWVQRWSVVGKADPLYFRCFSRYVGKDMNIVPENLCRNVIEKCLNPSRYLPYYTDKNIFDRLFPAGTCAVTVLRKMNGFFYDVLYNPVRIECDNDLQNHLDSSRVKSVCIKPSVGSGSGVGVRFYCRKEDGWRSCDKDTLLTVAELDRMYGKDFILQESLTQSQGMSYFNPTSVNTLRLTLYRSVTTDQWTVPSAIIRIGGKGSLVDNAHAGGAYVGINENDGSLCKTVLDQYGRSCEQFNDIDFTKDHTIPHWNEILEFALMIGNSIPHLRLLALDIMIDASGKPRLIEFNSSDYSMWLFQFTTHGAFGDYTEEIIRYCSDAGNNNPLYVELK